MSTVRRLIALALGASLALASCSSSLGPRKVPLLARCTLAQDYATYPLRRVGLMPVAGTTTAIVASALEESLVAELSRTTPFEVVRLSPADLQEVHRSEPYRQGKYQLSTIIDVAHRYRLDAVVFPTVVQEKTFMPLVLGVQMDVVASETGLVIWSGSVHLDGQDAAVRHGLRVYYSREDGGVTGQDWDVALLSPSRYARFAAYQLARLM